MKLQERNVLKVELEAYIFARNGNKLHDLMEKNASERIGDRATAREGGVTIGLDMAPWLSKLYGLYGDNLVLAMYDEPKVTDLHGFTISDATGANFKYETAMVVKTGAVALTKDRTPFGEGADDLVCDIKEILAILSRDSGAVAGFLTVNGEREAIEIGGDCLTECEETPDERRERLEKMYRASRGAGGGIDAFLASLADLFT